MSATRVLFIGGTGLISSACVAQCVAAGMDVTVLNRGKSSARPVPGGVEVLRADARSVGSVREVLGARSFDTVAQFVAFTPDHVQADFALFEGKCSQYIFIGTAAAYQTPPQRFPLRESTPLSNPFWRYAQDKIACERVLVDAWRDRGFPVTIVRPSHTYDRTQVPTTGGWTDLARMLRGAPVVVHGDGTTLWTLTHSSDFARAFGGLINRPETLGDAFHITSDETLTWNQIYDWLGKALGVEPRLVHVTSDAIARTAPQLAGGILGDKANCAIFDNSKIKSLVPGFHARVPFARGATGIVDWYLADKTRQPSDPELESVFDQLAAQAELSPA